MEDIKWRFIYLTVLLFHLFTHGQAFGEVCVSRYEKLTGLCKYDCKRKQNDPKFIEMRPKVCTTITRQPVLCCPIVVRVYPTNNSSKLNNNRNRVRISVRKCMEYNRLTKKIYPINSVIQQELIVNANCVNELAVAARRFQSAAGEFPHMAALGWTNFDGSTNFACGGVLISENFVLTAAHCFKRNGVSPDFVKLGATNLKGNHEDHTQTYKIQELIKHEEYRPKYFYNDIGLIRLVGKVRFTKYIRPACLWQTHQINHTTAIASGYGATEYAGDPTLELHKVELGIIHDEVCKYLNTPNTKLPQGIIESQLCAGNLNGGKDTCHGDSGGPLTVTNEHGSCNYYVIGLTSFGSAFCGGPNAPGVYTRISSFVSWIETKVWGSF